MQDPEDEEPGSFEGAYDYGIYPNDPILVEAKFDWGNDIITFTYVNQNGYEDFGSITL